LIRHYIYIYIKGVNLASEQVISDQPPKEKPNASSMKNQNYEIDNKLIIFNFYVLAVDTLLNSVFHGHELIDGTQLDIGGRLILLTISFGSIKFDFSFKLHGLVDDRQ
jgi:hypothetical protein